MSESTQQASADTIWMTQKTFDRLSAELEDLQGPLRSEIIARISAARDEGDLKENGGYHAAKDEQGKMEGRIRQLQDQLRHVTTEPAADDDRVSPGKLVTYRYAGDDETEQFLLGSRDVDDDEPDVEVFSPQSPMGTALLGAARARPSTSSHPTARPSRSRSSTRCRSPAELGAGSAAAVSHGMQGVRRFPVQIRAGRRVIATIPWETAAPVVRRPPGFSRRRGSRCRAAARAAGRRGRGRGSRAGAGPRPRRRAASARSARGSPRARWPRPR